MLLDLMIFLKKHYMIYIVIYSAYFISAWCFQSMTVGTDEGGGEAWNLLPQFLCFGNTNVYTAVLFQIKEPESSVPVSF